MTTIAEENRKALRQSVNVLCGFRETSEDPTAISVINCETAFEGIANLDPGLLPSTVMDLGGNGFPNDGRATPMETDSDSFRYGYISAEPAKADGTFDNPPGVTISANENWEYVTLEIRGQYGDSNIVLAEPNWSSGQTTVYVNSWNPGERVYIVGVFLGKAWIWNNSNLISVDLDLHSVNTEIGGELEVSSINIQAYEAGDYTDVIGRIPKGSPIWYASGYAGDMSELRNFYLSEDVAWDNNVLTVNGQDASMLLDGEEIPVDISSSSGSVNNRIASRVRNALAPISYVEIGSAPSINLQSGHSIVYHSGSPRSIISEYTNIFRDENGLRMTYVDAGVPTLWIGSSGYTWTIYADEIADMDIIVEHNKNELKMVIADYYNQWNSAIDEVEATAGKQYFVQFDTPVSNVIISPSPAVQSQVTWDVIKFTAAESATHTIEGREYLEELLDDNNPYTVSDYSKGETYKFDFDMPLFNNSSGQSLVKLGLAYLLNRSNILYEFTYRGNPHIQPRDVLNVEIATWETDYKTVTGLYPALDLYPDVDLYPYATYKKVRKMVKRWETMTVDTVTLGHSQGGGLTSKIRARKGDV